MPTDDVVSCCNAASFLRLQYMQERIGYPQAEESIDESDFDIEQFYRAHNVSLKRYVRMRIRVQEVAEDIVSETVAQFIAYCSDPEHVVRQHRALLFRIARARIADHYSSSQRKSELSIDAADDVMSPIDVSDQAMVTEELSAVQRALLQIPEDMRELIRLHGIVGLSIPEIAELMDISAGNTRIRLFRARRALKHALLTNETHDRTMDQQED